MIGCLVNNRNKKTHQNWIEWEFLWGIRLKLTNIMNKMNESK